MTQTPTDASQGTQLPDPTPSVLPPAPPSPDPDPPASARTRARIDFCLELGRCLQAFGTPAHRFEDTMARVCRRFGLEGQFFALPTGFLASISRGTYQRSYVQRGAGGDSDLEKISRLHEVTEEVLAGRMDAVEGSEALRDMLQAPPRYGVPLRILGQGLGSATAAVFFGGGWLEFGAGFVLGVVLGCLLLLGTGRRRVPFTLLPAVAATLVTFVAIALSHHLTDSSSHLLTLSGLVILLPGLGLVTAMNELATGNLVAGNARMAGVGLAFLQLASGVALGQHLGVKLLHAGSHPMPHPAPDWALWICMALWAVALTVSFLARPRDAGWILIASLLGFWGSRLGAHLLGPVFGAGLGAWLLGSASNLFARWRNRPAVVMLVPGILILLPGSLGLKSLELVLQNQVVAGLNTAFQMVFLTVALLIGLLVANVTVRTRVTL